MTDKRHSIWFHLVCWFGSLTVCAITLWVFASPSSGDGVIVFSPHTKKVNAVAFARDGKMLASASDDTTVRVWNIQDRDMVAVLDPPEGRFFGSEKAKGTIYDPITGRTPPFFTSLAFSAD